MEINEAYQLAEWIEEEINQTQTLSKFDDLINVFNSNIRRQNNQPLQPFEDQRLELISNLTNIKLHRLSVAQLKLLDELTIRPNIGKKGKKKIDSLLVDILDLATIHKELTEMRSQVQNGISKSNELKSALEEFVDVSLAPIEADQVLTRVTFDDDAAVRNIKDMKAWSSKWFDIGRGFAIANGQTPEDIQIVGGGRGSLVLELAILATTAVPIAKAINLILDSMVKYKDFQLKSIEVRKMKDENPKISNDLEEDAKRWEKRARLLKDDMSDEVAEEIKQYFPNFQEENQNEYEKAVKTLVDFISKGGDVDCVIADHDDENEEPNEVTEALEILREDFAQIRNHKETYLLEHRDTDGE